MTLVHERTHVPVLQYVLLCCLLYMVRGFVDGWGAVCAAVVLYGTVVPLYMGAGGWRGLFLVLHWCYSVQLQNTLLCTP